MSTHKAIPQIRKYMTTCPLHIEADSTLSEVHAIMRENHIRHLPITENQRLVGIISERDLHLIETLKDVDPKQVTAREAMSQHVYSVEPEASLYDVASSMASHKFGSAVIVQNSKIVGIFTTVDALQALADLLQTRLGV